MKEYCGCPEDSGNDISIRQYLRLDYLIQLLETQKYHVNRRYKSYDKRESSYNLSFEVGFSPIGVNVNPQPKPKKRIMSFGEIINCPTACWTKNANESYLMWKSYATEMGACIISSVNRVIKSLKVDLSKKEENRLVYGSMEYMEDCYSTIEEHHFFRKDIFYVDENEYRFYFDFKSCEPKNKDYILIPVDTTTMIEEVQLSPFICPEAADKLKRMLNCSYNVNVSPSNIKIKS
jgi:hypothetical protein